MLPDESAKYGSAAPFERNGHLFEALPAGLFLFFGAGTQDNVAGKGGKQGKPLWDFQRAN
ncbi:hypothetical protein [Sphingopyxis chilensis]|jgi:hypothetical protein